jgi:hypothetical protein
MKLTGWNSGLSKRRHSVLSITALDIIQLSVIYLKNTMFRKLDSVSVFRWSLFIWAQQIELVYDCDNYTNILQNKFRDLSQRANYTDRATACLSAKVSANFYGQRVSRGHCNGSPRPYSRVSRPKPLLFHPNSSSIVLTRLSGPRSKPTTSQEIW